MIGLRRGPFSMHFFLIQRQNFFGFSRSNPCYRPGFFVASTQTAGLQSWCWWSPFFEPTFNEQGARLDTVRCATLRHAEMPKEPRRVPTVATGSLTAHPTRPRGSALFLARHPGGFLCPVPAKQNRPRIFTDPHR